MAGQQQKRRIEGDHPFSIPSTPKRRVRVTPGAGGRLIVQVPTLDTDETDDEDLEHATLTEDEKAGFNFMQNSDVGSSTGSVSSRSENFQSQPPTPTPRRRAVAVPTFAEDISMAVRLESAYEQHRVAALRKDQFDTPLAVLHGMAQDYGVQAQVHHEVHEIRKLDEPVRFLAEVFVGMKVGYGEASSKKLALQMGAAHLLRKLEQENFDVPPYYLVPGCRINPHVFRDLAMVCEILEVERPFLVMQPKDPERPDGPRFTVKCQVGTMIAIGENDCLLLARRSAAKTALEMLLGKEVPLDFICTGPACMALIRAKIKAVASQRKLAIRQRRFEAGLAFSPNLAGSSKRVSGDARRNDHQEENSEFGFEEEADIGGSVESVIPLVAGTSNKQTDARLKNYMDELTEVTKKKLADLKLTNKSKNIVIKKEKL